MLIYKSIYIYISIFVASTIFYSIAYQIDYKNNVKSTKERILNKIIILACLIIGILIPCVLAALRADTVGADTSGYAVLGFKYLAQMTSLRTVIRNYSEWAFYGVGYLISRFSNNVEYFLGTIEFLIIFPVVIGGWKIRKKVCFPFFMLLFYFKFFNYSLCIMRQSISCSFIFLAYILYSEKKAIRAFMIALIGALFHSTGFFGISIILLVILYDRVIGNKKDKRFIDAEQEFFAVMAVFLMSLFKGIVTIIIKFLPERYSDYMEFIYGKDAYSRYGFFESTVRIICFILILLVFNSLSRKEKNEWKIVGYLAISGIVMYVMLFITWRVSVGYRVTEYLDYFMILFVALVPNCIKIKLGQKNMSHILLVILFFVYWLFSYILYPEGLGFRTEIFKFR